jgi:hypothetical protein
MESSNRYQFNFTAGAAMIQESITVAETFVACDEDWNRTVDAIDKGNLLLKTKSASARRLLNLVVSRLKTLTSTQLHLLTILPDAEKRLVVLLSIVKKHSIVYDFIVHTLREKYFNFELTLNYADFNSFLRDIETEHPEIDEISDTTLKKTRQIIFKILAETGLITANKDSTIEKPLLSEELETSIINDDPCLLKAMLYSNSELQQAINKIK